MIIEFYTGRDIQFVVSQDKLFRNGEVIEEGVITIKHLMMNEPSWIMVDKGELNPPLFIKTDKVTAVLPNNEFFNGKRCTRKDFKVSFLAHIQNKWVTSEKVVSAVNETHVQRLIRAQYGEEVRSISAIATAISDILTPTPILV